MLSVKKELVESGGEETKALLRPMSDEELELEDVRVFCTITLFSYLGFGTAWAGFEAALTSSVSAILLGAIVLTTIHLSYLRREE